MFKMLWRKKVLVIFLIAMIILFPAASVKPAQMLSKTLLLTIGIDKSAEGFEVSGIMSVNKFTQDGETTTKAVSAKAANINSALKKITADNGREVSLAHCNLIVVGAGASNENLAGMLNYFLRQYDMSNNVLIICTDGDVKALQEAGISNKTGAKGGLLETVAAFNQKDVFARDTTLDEFYKNYLRESSSAILGIVNLKDGAIENTKGGAVFKRGKRVVNLTPDQMWALSFLNTGITADPIILNGVTGEGLDKAQIVLKLKSKDSRTETKIKDGIPVVKITLNSAAQIEEITDPANPEQFIEFKQNPPLKSVQDALSLKISNELAGALLYIKTDKTDYLNLYGLFHRYNTQDFARCMQANNHDIDNFLSSIKFELYINTKILV